MGLDWMGWGWRNGLGGARVSLIWLHRCENVFMCVRLPTTHNDIMRQVGHVIEMEDLSPATDNENWGLLHAFGLTQVVASSLPSHVNNSDMGRQTHRTATSGW